jgi:hypothetical protein
MLALAADWCFGFDALAHTAVALLPHRRAHAAVCTPLRVLLVCSPLAAPDAGI